MITPKHLDPQNPLYYAPRRLREQSAEPFISYANNSAGALPSERAPYDSLLEQAVAESLRHPLEPEFVAESPGFTLEPSGFAKFLSTAGRFSAATAVAGFIALFFTYGIPVARDTLRPTEKTTSSPSDFLDSMAAKIGAPADSFRNANGAVSGEASESAARQQSEEILQQFVRWQHKPATQLTSETNR